MLALRLRSIRSLHNKPLVPARKSDALLPAAFGLIKNGRKDNRPADRLGNRRIDDCGVDPFQTIAAASQETRGKRVCLGTALSQQWTNAAPTTSVAD